MITPQLTEQYGHVLRVSVVLAILSPCACAYTGARLNPNTETPAPPIKVVLMKVRLETSMTGTPSNSNCEIAGRTTWGVQIEGDKKVDELSCENSSPKDYASLGIPQLPPPCALAKNFS